MSDQNIGLLRMFFDACNTHDPGQLIGARTDDYAHHDPQLPVTHIYGLAQYQEMPSGFFEAFPAASHF